MSEPGEERSRLPIPVVAVMLVVAALCLRWPYEVTLETLRGAGHTDRTIAAFVSTFFMLVAGLPGLLAVAMGWRLESLPRRALVAASLVSLLVGALASLVWIGASVKAIGGTLSIAQIAGSAAPPLLTALIAVWSRFRLRSESRNTDS